MTHISRFFLTTLLAVAASAATVSPVAAAAPPTGAPQPPSPATGHAQVIAQQVVELAAGAHHWSFGGEAVDPGADVTPLAAGAGFVVATGGTLVAVDGGGRPTARLGVGEATSLATAGDVSLVAAEGQPAAYLTIALTAGEPASPPPATGGAFTPGAGLHDVDLVRDVLPSAGTTTLAGTGAAPVLLVVTEGALSVAADDSVTLAQGDVLPFAGAVQITNAGEATATFVAAIIGPVIDPASLPIVTTTTTTSTTTTTTTPTTTTTATAEPAACATYTENDQYPLQLCDQGAAVQFMQNVLHDAGFDVVPDGFFGPQTEQAVRAFQAAHGLEVDGLVGPQTWRQVIMIAPLCCIPGDDIDGNGIEDPYELGVFLDEPSVSFSPSNPPPGGEIAVSGSGCPAGTQVAVGTGLSLGVYSGTVIATTLADGEGTFAVTTTLHPYVLPGEEFRVWVECGSGYVEELSTVGGEPVSLADSDDDGLPDAREELLGTDPNNADTDGDGVYDGAEFEFGTDPLDPSSYPELDE